MAQQRVEIGAQHAHAFRGVGDVLGAAVEGVAAALLDLEEVEAESVFLAAPSVPEREAGFEHNWAFAVMANARANREKELANREKGAPALKRQVDALEKQVDALQKQIEQMKEIDRSLEEKRRTMPPRK